MRRLPADRAEPRDLTDAEYRALAELRYRIRRFIHFSERAARAAGLEPQQHQLLLAVRGLPEDVAPNVSTLAERLQLANNSVQELVRRTEARDLITTDRGPVDRRQVLVTLTDAGEAALHELSLAHLVELRAEAAELTRWLERLVA
jgi:DNA-binding MarR family transcriptional regulator